jgi:GNAT superfamily N-acetyltransferase
VKPKVARWANHQPGFYALLGPYLSRRNIVADLGGSVWDDDGKTWYVAMVTGGAVAGFCAALATGERQARYASDYVLPAHRRRGVYRDLFAAREEDWADCTVAATVTAAGMPLYLAAGFTAVRPQGRYTAMTRDAAGERR